MARAIPRPLVCPSGRMPERADTAVPETGALIDSRSADDGPPLGPAPFGDGTHAARRVRDSHRDFTMAVGVVDRFIGIEVEGVTGRLESRAAPSG